MFAGRSMQAERKIRTAATDASPVRRDRCASRALTERRLGNQAVLRRMGGAAAPGYFGDVTDTPTFDGGAPGTDGGGVHGGGAVPLDGGAGGGGCATVCDRAYADSSLNFGGGGVICNGALKCACAFDVPPLTRGFCPGFDANVLAHETRHLGEVDCNPTGGLHRPPFRDPSSGTAHECTHRRESIAGLDAIIPGSAGICRTGMQTIRAGLQSWVTANCGGP